MKNRWKGHQQPCPTQNEAGPVGYHLELFKTQPNLATVASARRQYVRARGAALPVAAPAILMLFAKCKPRIYVASLFNFPAIFAFKHAIQRNSNLSKSVVSLANNAVSIDVIRRMGDVSSLDQRLESALSVDLGNVVDLCPHTLTKVVGRWGVCPDRAPAAWLAGAKIVAKLS